MCKVQILLLSILLIAVTQSIVPEVDFTDKTTLQILRDSYANYQGILGDSVVLLNAASRAKVTLDTNDPFLPCGQAINVTGSYRCLNEYWKFTQSTPNLQYKIFVSEKSAICKYQIYFPCSKFDKPSNGDLAIISKNISATIDGDMNTIWASPVFPGLGTPSPVLTIDLRVPFKIFAVQLVINTLPETTKLEGSLGGSDYSELIPGLASYSLNVQSLAISVDGVLLDKIRVSFSPYQPTEDGYSTNYLVISDFKIVATCACDPEKGQCTSGEDPTIPQSVAAGYHCECSQHRSGFLCDTLGCGDSQYKKDDGCIDCGCGPGSLYVNCTTEGVCSCNSTALPDENLWDNKCQIPYIKSVEPQVGIKAGGTPVTITGGLLSNLMIENCEIAQDCLSGKDCPNRETKIICRMKSAPAGVTQMVLFTARNTNNEETTYTFEYKDSGNITAIDPRIGFVSGGNPITLSGDNLDIPGEIKLVYYMQCKNTKSSWNVTQNCKVVTPQKAECIAVDFCKIKNKNCPQIRSPNAKPCPDAGDVVGNNRDNIILQVGVVMDSDQRFATFAEFVLMEDPVIFEWQNSLKVIEADTEVFTVPGEKLDIGARLEDYKVDIAGTPAQPVSISDKNLTVRIPNSRPTGVTIVSIGNVKKNVGELQIKNVLDLVVILVPSILGGLILILIVILILILLWRKKKRDFVKKKGMDTLTKGYNIRYIRRNGDVGSLVIPTISNTSSEQLDVLKKWLIDRERLNLSTLIGCGQFGKVYKGYLQYDDGRHYTVAAKTVRYETGLTEMTIDAFIKEATIMKDFNHPNVLSLVGMVYDNENMPIVLLPYMEHGDVKTLIKKDDHEFSLGDLLHFGMQIAFGMEYLASLRFVHRDIAARNCMVNADYIVKIADFGLSHDVYRDDYYRLHEGSSKPLPVKWMAVESLVAGLFTTKSDVWSFGVVMWELLTRGLTPYSSISNYEIAAYIKSGERLEQPDYCPDVIYDMMMSCWSAAADERPTFKQLAEDLKSILEEANFQDRTKTKNIADDYYLQLEKEQEKKQQLDELYLEIIT